MSYCIVCIATVLGCSSSEAPMRLSEPGKGFMMVSELDDTTIVDLSGWWEFHWKRLNHGGYGEVNDHSMTSDFMYIPGLWNRNSKNGKWIPRTGYATYRRIIILDKNINLPRRVAFKIPDIGTAYRFFVNNKEIASGGVVGSNARLSIPGYNPIIAECNIDDPKIEINIQVSNFHYRNGGIWERILFGNPTSLKKIREKNIAWSLFIFGALSIIGLYHLILFSFRMKDHAHLFFGIFCFLIATRSIATGEYFIIEIFPWLSWGSIIKIEYLTFFLAVPFFFAYMRTLFNAIFSKWVLHAVIILSAVFSLAVILFRSETFTMILLPFQLITVGICIYGIYILFYALINRYEGALAFFIGFCFIFIAVINDFLHNNMLIRTEYLVPLGLFFFIISQAILLSIRFSRAYVIVEKLSAELI